MRKSGKIALGLTALGLAALATTWTVPVLAQNAQDALKTGGVVERLLKQGGVYNAAPGVRTPNFVIDPAWPQPLPDSWLLGQIAGLYVDRHDHVWVLNRPRTLTNDESGLQGKAGDQNVSPLGFPRPFGAGADCCNPAPSVMVFDASGKMLRHWGGPSDPGFIGGRCKEADGCIWPNTEHGIYVDHQDNVWIAGNSAAVPAQKTAWTTNPHGGDGFILKFDRDGNFKMRIGGTPTGPNSNDTNGGINGTPVLYQPADMVVDPKTNRLYVADGYGNRRVLIADATTGKYIGHFGAYGGNPVDDAAAKVGTWPEDRAKGMRKPSYFRGPVHCVKLAEDGKLYVCDRGNNRIQVFDTKSPALGKACTNPQGVAGRCGFVSETFVSEATYTQPLMPGTAVSMSFSTDPAQSCLYVGDNTNQTIYVLNRDNLHELARFGRNGRGPGEFHWLHQVSLDSKGNVYTAEVDTGKRVQKFLRYGGLGCAGTGHATVGGVAR